MAMRYWIDVSHPGLGTFQRITGSDADVVQQRADAKLAQWAEQWERQQLRYQRERAVQMARAQSALRRGAQERARDEAREYHAARTSEADALTIEATRQVGAIEGLLASALGVDVRVNFESLKDRGQFADPAPPRPSIDRNPPEPEPYDGSADLPPEPQPEYRQA